MTVPVNATTTGFCGEKTANMTLSWEEAATNQMGIIKKNKITFNYAHNNANFFLDSILVDIHLNGNIFSSYIKLYFEILQKCIRISYYLPFNYYNIVKEIL